MRLRINLTWLIFSIVAVLFLVCDYATAAEPTDVTSQMTLIDFLGDNWAAIGLVISEAASFLPTKFAGIVKTVVTIIGAIFAKKK